MNLPAEDLASPARALSAGLESLADAISEDEPRRRGQHARTAADYAAEVWWHPLSSAVQRAQAARCLTLSYALDEETRAHHARLRAVGHRTAPAAQ